MRISTTLPKKMEKRVRRAARSMGVTRAELLRNALEHFLLLDEAEQADEKRELVRTRKRVR